VGGIDGLSAFELLMIFRGYPGLVGTYEATGIAYLTTTRLILVRENADPTFRGPGFIAYAISYSLIGNEQVKDPTFGSPYIKCIFSATVCSR